MNWIGGARNRVKVGGERKIQQEFFEKQRLQSSASKLSSKKKKQNSQDLVALYALNRIHSGTFSNSGSRIKHVNLDKFRSCTRRIDEVDMGNCSPTETPSKLVLHDDQNKKNSNSSTTINEFCKPSEVSVNSSISKSRKDSHDSSILKQNSFPDEVKVKNGSCYNPRNKEKIDQTDTMLETGTRNDYMYGCPDNKTIETKRKLDMFVSEDFQTTPLTSYKKSKHSSKKNNPSNGNDLKNRLSHDDLLPISNENSYLFREEPLFSTDSHVTSTPVSIGNSIKCKQNLKVLDNISPIFNDYSHRTSNDDKFKGGFTFTPHTTSNRSKYDLLNLTENVFMKSSNQDKTISPAHVTSHSYDKFEDIYNSDKIHDNYFDLPKYQSHQTSSHGSEDFISPIKTNYSIGQCREHDLFHSERPKFILYQSEKPLLEIPGGKYDENISVIPKTGGNVSKCKSKNFMDEIQYQQTPFHNNLSMIKDLYTGMSTERLNFSSNIDGVPVRDRGEDLLNEMKDLDDVSFNNDIILYENILDEEIPHQKENSKTRSQDLKCVTVIDDKYLPSSNEFHDLQTMNPGQIDDNTHIEYDSPLCPRMSCSDDENKVNSVLNADTKGVSDNYQHTDERISHVNENTREESDNFSQDNNNIDVGQFCTDTEVDQQHSYLVQDKDTKQSCDVMTHSVSCLDESPSDFVSLSQVENPVSQPEVEIKSISQPEEGMKSVSQSHIEIKFVSQPEVGMKSVSQPEVGIIKSVSQPEVGTKSVSQPGMNFISQPEVEIKSILQSEVGVNAVSQPVVGMNAVSQFNYELVSSSKVQINSFTQTEVESKSVYQQTDKVCECMTVQTVPKLSNLCLMKMVKLCWNFSLNICEKMNFNT